MRYCFESSSYDMNYVVTCKLYSQYKSVGTVMLWEGYQIVCINIVCPYIILNVIHVSMKSFLYLFFLDNRFSHLLVIKCLLSLNHCFNEVYVKRLRTCIRKRLRSSALIFCILFYLVHVKCTGTGTRKIMHVFVSRSPHLHIIISD